MIKTIYCVAPEGNFRLQHFQSFKQLAEERDVEDYGQLHFFEVESDRFFWLDGFEPILATELVEMEAHFKMEYEEVRIEIHCIWQDGAEYFSKQI